MGIALAWREEKEEYIKRFKEYYQMYLENENPEEKAELFGFIKEQQNVLYHIFDMNEYELMDIREWIEKTVQYPDKVGYLVKEKRYDLRTAASYRKRGRTGESGINCNA